MFDIDKVFLSTLFRDAYGNTEFEDDILKKTANDLIKAYIAILKDTERSSTELNGSIDNDTLLIKEVVRDIFGKLTTTVQPYAAYTMRSQFSSKDEFINGKRGIGPFALNNNNHILTMLYGVEFKHKEHSLIDQLGLNSLHSSTDKDGKSIMSWLSGFINAHVDVAKDPYISKLNVNPYTYNLVSFLIRTGYGADTLYFTSQPIMRQLAEAYANATGKYMVDLTKSSFKLAEEAENTVLLDTINSYLDTNYADVNEAVNSWLSAKFDFGPSNIDTMIEAVLKDNPDILRDIARNYIKHNGVYPAIYNVSIAGNDIQLTTTDVQILVALANQKFKPYATALSELVKYSKIDTKKEGKSVVEQIKYVEGYEGIFDQDNASGTRFMFDTESLDRLLTGSYIGTKTTNATLTFLSILGEQLIESTRYFLIEMRNLISSCPQLREYTTKDLKSVVGQLMAKIKSQFFFGTNGYATKLGIDVKGLVTGNNTIYDRLLRIEADLANDPQYKDLVDSDGNPLNYLLRNLVSGSKYEFLMPIRPANGTMADTYDHAKFVRPLSFMNDETVNADELSQAWDDLLRDTAHPELQKFAQDLIVYAFITSGDNGGRTDIFKYVPNSWKLGIEELGEGYEGSYAEYMSNVLNDYKAGRNMMTRLDYDSIILNNWHDSKYVPIVKLVENNEALFETWMNSPSGGFPIMLAGINRFGKAFDTQSKFIKIKRNHIAGEVNGQREYVIYERVGYGKRYITSTNDKGKVVISEVDYPVYMMVDPQGIKFSTLDKSFVLGYGQQPTQEARQQVLSQLSDLITMLNGIGANIVDGTGIDIVQQIIDFADSKGKASISVLAKFGMPLQFASIVEEMIQYNHPLMLQEKPSSVTYYSGNIVPEPNTIFVFGSNIEGRHGDGSAKIAMNMFGAQYGVAEGITGQAYALPTKDLAKGERSLTREQIVENIRHMYEAAKANPTLNFKVAYRNGPDEKTRNGYTGREMIEMFLDAGPIPSNVWFSQEWVNTGLFLVEYAEEGQPTVPQNTYPVPADTRSDTKLVITPIQAADKKATAKGSISNKFIGFAEGIQGSSTAEYARLAGDKANTGDYNADDVIFVSIPGKRGDDIVRSVLQELTIEEALKALEAGATLVTDNADYVASSDYNEGEKLLAESLQAAGATYSERTVDGQVLGIWKKLTQQSSAQDQSDSRENDGIMYHKVTGVTSHDKLILIDHYVNTTIRDQAKQYISKLGIVSAIANMIESGQNRFFDYNDSENQKLENVSERKEQIRQFFKSYDIPDFMYEIKDVRLNDGSIKVYVKVLTDASLIIEKLSENAVDYVDRLSDSEIESLLYLIQQEYARKHDDDDVLFYINPKNSDQIKERIKNSLTEQYLFYLDLIDSGFSYLEELSNDKETNLFVKTALNWLKNVPLSGDQLQELLPLFQSARLKSVDILKFKTPLDLIQWYIESNKKDVEQSKGVNASDYPGVSFDSEVVLDDGTIVQIYNVENNETGQLSVSKILYDTNPSVNGKKLNFSPWCLSTFNAPDGVVKSTDSAKRYWEHYNQGKRQIAMINGYPVAFNSTAFGGDQWWDFNDRTGFANIKEISVKSRSDVLNDKSNDARRTVRVGFKFGMYYLENEDVLEFDDPNLGISVVSRNNVVRWVELRDPSGIYVSFERLSHPNSSLIHRFLIDSGKFLLVPELLRASSVVYHLDRTIRDFIKYEQISEIPWIADLFKSENVSKQLNEVRSVYTKIKELVDLSNESTSSILDKNGLFNIRPLAELRVQLKNAFAELAFEINQYFMFDEKGTLFVESVKLKRQSKLTAKRNTRNKINTNYNVEDELNPPNGQIDIPNNVNPTYVGEDIIDEAIADVYEQTRLPGLYQEGILKPINKDLEKHLRKILKKFHFEIIDSDIIFQVFGNDTLGAFDFLQKIIYLANSENRNEITFPEEFSHAFIKMMGAVYHKAENRYKWPETKLYSELRDLIEKTDFYKLVYDQYSGVYQFPNHTPNTVAIKEEALGKALAAVLAKKAENFKEKSFFQKLKDWFFSVIDRFKSKIDQVEAEENIDLMQELNKIADSILDGSYFKKYLKKIDDKGYKKMSYKKTIALAKKVDGGKAYNIAKFFTEIGGIITGSLSYRLQGTIYRKSVEALHDLDVAFSPTSFTGSYHFYNTSDEILQTVLNEPIISRIKERYPDFNVIGAFYRDNRVIVNAMICEDPSLYERFCNMTGNFNSRMSQFTEEEQKKMYLIDMFFMSDTSAFDNAIKDEENDLLLTNYVVPFREKLKFGRAKDLYDYQMFKPYSRIYKPAYQQSKMYLVDNSLKGLLRRLGEKLMKKCKGQ